MAETKKIKSNNRLQSGISIIYTVLSIFIFSMVMLAVLQYATTQLRLLRIASTREQAFQVAEAGINYYQWHLAHFPTDYWDGNASTTPGPFVHDFVDTDTQDTVGRYSLQITPPAVGSTIVTIKSTGYTLDNPQVTRTVTARYGVPSLAQYAFLTNTSAWIGPNENITGQFMANGGIRFDGTGNAPIMSAKQTYSCSSWSGSPCPATKPGIWGGASQSTQDFWQYPVPNVSFSSMTADLANMKSQAKIDGAPAYLASSGKSGYSLVFNANGTVNIYIVKKLLAAPHESWDVNGNAVNNSIDYDPNQRQLLYSDVSIPAHGIFYVEDNVWVEGVVHGRALVVAAKIPYNSGSAPDIYIPNNITYTANNGLDILGLLSQQDIVVTYNAPTDLTINAALIAQNGSVEVYQYDAYDNIKNSITLNGSLASFGQWTWTYVDNNKNPVSGFANTYTNYDANLIYSPPPSFPLSSSGYRQMSWSSN